MIRKEITSFNTEIFKEFHNNFALLTAGGEDEVNTMTISWGFMGTLWNKNVICVFVRPSRYTYPLMNKSERFTLSFMPDDMKDKVIYMGRHSGKNENKYESTGLIPILDTDFNISYIKGAKYVFKCKTLYADDFNEGSFIDKSLIMDHYKGNLSELHRFYIAEVTSLLIPDED